MSSIEKVIPFQRKILTSLAIWEGRIAELYETYARLYPRTRATWGPLAKEERQHAAVLMALNKELDKGHLLWELGRFQDGAIADKMELVNRALKRVLCEELSEMEIVQSAIEIENTILEANFYQLVSSDSPHYTHVAHAMTKATDQHLERLKELIRNHAGDNDWRI